MVECPVDGCSYSNESENSVIAHMSSSKGDHKGIGFQKARQMLNYSGGSTDTIDNSPDAKPDSTPAEPVSDGEGGENPAMDTPDDDGAQGGMSDPECPECGRSGDDLEWFDASKVYPEYTHGCNHCSTDEEWVVWSE